MVVKNYLNYFFIINSEVGKTTECHMGHFPQHYYPLISHSTVFQQDQVLIKIIKCSSFSMVWKLLHLEKLNGDLKNILNTFFIIIHKVAKLLNGAWVIFHNTHFHPLLACSSVFKQNWVSVKIIQHSRFLLLYQNEKLNSIPHGDQKLILNAFFIINSEVGKTAKWHTGLFPQHSLSSCCSKLQCVQTKLCLDKKYFNVKVFYDMEKFVRKKFNCKTPGFLKIILSTFS